MFVKNSNRETQNTMEKKEKEKGKILFDFFLSKIQWKGNFVFVSFHKKSFRNLDEMLDDSISNKQYPLKIIEFHKNKGCASKIADQKNRLFAAFPLLIIFLTILWPTKTFQTLNT